MMKVKPRDGLKIRDPQRGDLIEIEGRCVPKTTYWLHRLRDRDVILVSDDPSPVVTKTARKPARKPIQQTVSVLEAGEAEDDTSDQIKSPKGGAIEE